MTALLFHLALPTPHPIPSSGIALEIPMQSSLPRSCMEAGYVQCITQMLHLYIVHMDICSAYTHRVRDEITSIYL